MSNPCVATTNTEVPQNSISGRVAANSFWYGLEIAANFASVFFTSIAIARAFGPKQLGYFNYVLWIANMAGAVGALGLPAATRKYMAEHLASGSPGIARAIFFGMLRVQFLLASVLSALGLLWVMKSSDPHYSLISAFLVLTLLPRMLTLIPSLANVAAENFRANTPGALTGVFVYVIAVTISLKCGWGLLGVAIGMLLSACLELGVKLYSALRWIGPLPKGAPIPPDLKHRMFRFSGQSILLMLIDLVVWNRSDIFFLKLLDKDIRQIAFFSLAFNLSEKVGLVPDILGGAMGVSVMAQYTRSRAAVRSMISTAAAYMLLFAIPLLLGLAALSGPIVQTLYGAQYLPAIPVLAVGSLFAISKTLRHPVEELLQAAEEQKFIILWFCLCGAVNVVLDLILIPGHGAIGAAIANGIAQMLAVLGTWSRAGSIFGLSLRTGALLKLSFSGLAMAAAVIGLSAFLTHWSALLLGTFAGSLVYCAMLRFTRAFTMDDRQRFLSVGSSLPASMHAYFDLLIGAVIPARTPFGMELSHRVVSDT